MAFGSSARDQNVLTVPFGPVLVVLPLLWLLLADATVAPAAIAMPVELSYIDTSVMRIVEPTALALTAVLLLVSSL
jgi:hypothetical protein